MISAWIWLTDTDKRTPARACRRRNALSDQGWWSARVGCCGDAGGRRARTRRSAGTNDGDDDRRRKRGGRRQQRVRGTEAGAERAEGAVHRRVVGHPGRLAKRPARVAQNPDRVGGWSGTGVVGVPQALRKLVGRDGSCRRRSPARPGRTAGPPRRRAAFGWRTPSPRAAAGPRDRWRRGHHRRPAAQYISQRTGSTQRDPAAR